MALHRTIADDERIQHVLCTGNHLQSKFAVRSMTDLQHRVGRENVSEHLIDACGDGFVRIGGGAAALLDVQRYRLRHPTAPILELSLGYYDTHFPRAPSRTLTVQLTHPDQGGWSSWVIVQPCKDGTLHPLLVVIDDHTIPRESVKAISTFRVSSLKAPFRVKQEEGMEWVMCPCRMLQR